MSRADSSPVPDADYHPKKLSPNRGPTHLNLPLPNQGQNVVLKRNKPVLLTMSAILRHVEGSHTSGFNFQNKIKTYKESITSFKNKDL